MKLKYFFICSWMSICLLSACTDALDRSPDGNMSMQDVMADPTRVEALLNKCYHQIPVKGYFYRWHDALVVAMSDDGWCSEELQGQIVQYLYSDNTTAAYHPMTDFPSDMDGSAVDLDGHYTSNSLHFWANYWPQIRLCSQFIELIDQATVRSESDRRRFKAEAHVLRAFYYCELVKWFGKVPILDKTVPFDTDFTVMKRDAVYDIAKFAGSDCDVAINTLELPWRITDAGDALRVTKALAWTLKAKMMLFAASPLHNENND